VHWNFCENPERPKKQMSVLYSLLSTAAAIAAFFLVPWPWYFALLAAFGVYTATAIVRVIYWKMTERPVP
jgi:hypothetical protein